MNEIYGAIFNKFTFLHVTFMFAMSAMGYGVSKTLKDALGTIGIEINKEGEKKWRKFFGSVVTMIFVFQLFIALFLHLYF
jgi:hypothetical protein